MKILVDSVVFDSDEITGGMAQNWKNLEQSYFIYLRSGGCVHVELPEVEVKRRIHDALQAEASSLVLIPKTKCLHSPVDVMGLGQLARKMKEAREDTSEGSRILSPVTWNGYKRL